MPKPTIIKGELRLPAALAERLKQEAARQHTSRHAIILQALDQFVADLPPGTYDERPSTRRRPKP